MNRTLTRLALAAALLVPAAQARAQSPTPEGTVITNTATASFTDANNNTYAPATATVSVTVGFLPGIDVVAPATTTPASPSTGNQLAITINNIGNGRDTVTLAVNSGPGVTITGYTYGGTTYPTLTALNTALLAGGINAGSNEQVTILYDVAAGQGGQSIPISVTGTSKRSPATTDAATTNVQPPIVRGVNVGPDGATVDRLPSNGAQYPQTFTITNSGNAQETFALAATLAPGTAVTVVSVNGAAGSNTTITLASGASQNVTVVYTVGQVAAGTSDKLTLTATAQGDNAVKDTGDLTVRVIRAAVSMTKEVFRDNKATAITAADRVLPGEFIQYKITVTNAGAAVASNVQISDPLPSQVLYDSNATDAAGWSISVSGSALTATLSGTLATGESRFFWVRVKVK